MHISERGIKLIQEFEGLRLRSYLCPANVWTIGYGSTGPHVRSGMVITKAEAVDLLKRDLVRFEQGVLRAVAPKIPNQNQFDAMVSLAFNIGTAAFARSTVARQFKNGNIVASANAFGMWTKAKGKTLPGLVRRRASEKELFLIDSVPVVERRASQTSTVTVPQESVVPDAPKPLTRSREVIGGVVVTASGAGSILNQITVEDAQQIKTTVQEIRTDSTPWLETLHVPEIASGALVVIGIFIAYKRIRDRLKGIR